VNRDRIIIWNETGEVISKAKISKDVSRGIILTYKSARTIDGKRINAVIPRKSNKYNETAINGTLVHISKLK